MSEMKQSAPIPLEQIDNHRFRIPRSFKKGMRVDGVIYADEILIKDILKDQAIDQVVNVAHLPGIIEASLAMPDLHWGYGFPIGGVAATDIEAGGVISPGGVGFDINCGVRLIRTDLKKEDIKPYIDKLLSVIFQRVPSGVGSKSSLKLSRKEETQILKNGVKWALANGFATEEDLECTEDRGTIPGANPDAVSDRAYERGRNQVGTLGSGNHFLEIQVIDKIYDESAAAALNLFKDQVTIMIHCGSRGLGHQICDDYCRNIEKSMIRYNIKVPDRQLACAPVKSKEGQAYLGAMRCAVNYAWVNRQHIMQKVRESFESVFQKSWRAMGLQLVYDVAHNVAKIESHQVKQNNRRLCVHRKGATRAFGPGHSDLPEKYSTVGQPVIIPGDMGRFSFVLTGCPEGRQSFFSCCHGAGRMLSRKKAKKTFHYQEIMNKMNSQGIFLKAKSVATVSEEAPGVYKDVSRVVEVVHRAGLARKVCRMRPLAVMKG